MVLRRLDSSAETKPGIAIRTKTPSSATTTKSSIREKARIAGIARSVRWAAEDWIGTVKASKKTTLVAVD